MDPYKTPDAALETDSDNPHQPVRAVIYGLCISIILVTLASIVEGIGFGIALGVDLSDQAGFKAMLATSTAFMVTDILVSSVLFYWAGRVVGKRVPGKELKYGIIVTLLTLAIFLPLIIDSDTFDHYPLWYNLVSIIVFLVVIPLGAISTVKSKKHGH
ncbi:MAG: hypothetical protein PVF34_09465 [Gammaproteobacteria bacterium]